MKNIVLGIIGALLCLYTILLGLNVYIIATNQNKLENVTARVVERTLEKEYQKGAADAVKKEVVQNIQDEILGEYGNNKKIKVKLRAIDLEKGILSVEVKQEFYLLNGRKKEIVIEKTALIDKASTEEPKVLVTFMVDEEVYKRYSLVKGEACPTPKVPSESFAGWQEYGQEGEQPKKKIGKVTEDTIYVAVFE